MNLTEKHIEQLYEFTRKHFVEYYDLQTELVDHLANGIEAKWQENPELTFDEILNLEFKKFGIFGFMNVVESRQMAMTKKYHKLVWKHFIEFFEVPKIIFTIFATSFLFVALKNSLINDFLAFVIVLLGAIFPFIAMVQNQLKKKSQIEENKKRWLFEEIISSYGTIMFIGALPIQFLIHFPKVAFINNYTLLILSFLIVSYYLVNYIILKIIPSKTEEYLRETYPEYEISK